MNKKKLKSKVRELLLKDLTANILLGSMPRPPASLPASGTESKETLRMMDKFRQTLVDKWKAECDKILVEYNKELIEANKKVDKMMKELNLQGKSK